MPLNIDITRDPYFKRGEKRGENRGEIRGENRRAEQIAVNMLRDGELSDAKISRFTGVSVERVRDLKEEH